MQGFFSWEQDGSAQMPLYMPKAKLSLIPKYNVGQTRSSLSQGISAGPDPAMPGAPQMPKSPATGGSGGSSSTKKKEEEDPTSPDYEMQEPDFPSVPNYTGADPWNPEHYEGMYIDPENPIYGQIGNGLVDLANPVFDPSNYQGLLTGSISDLNPVFNPDAYSGTLYDVNNPFGLQEEAGGLLGKLGGIYDKYKSIVPWLSAAKLGYDLFTGDGNTASKVQQGITQGVPTALGLITGSGPAAPITAAMYGGLAIAQAIGANQNKPSRDYFDPYYQADLGDGMQFLLGNSAGDWQENMTPEQSWTQVLDQLADGRKNAAFVKDDAGHLFGIPMDVIFDQGWQRPLTDEEQFLETAGMGGYTPDQTSTRNWLAETYTPEAINQNIMDYMGSGDAERIGLGLFKDTPVITGTGKDPLVYESVLAGFDVSQPYFGNEYEAYDTGWKNKDEQMQYDMLNSMGYQDTNPELLDFLGV